MATMLGDAALGAASDRRPRRGRLMAIGSALASAWLAPTFALGHDGVYAWKMLLGLLPALRRRFAPGGAS